MCYMSYSHNEFAVTSTCTVLKQTTVPNSRSTKKYIIDNRFCVLFNACVN